MALITKFIPKSVKSNLKRFMYKHSHSISQAGQDFWVYGEAFNEKRCGYYLDIGAHDGIHINNTFLLESKYNWSGICIEANPITFEKLKYNRNAICLNYCLDQSEGEVDFVLRGVFGGIVDRDVDNKKSDKKTDKVIKLKTISLIDVLENHHAPSIIDYLSIDVEGAEERILAGFDFRKFTFRCITIERPTKHLRHLFEDHGYILIKNIPWLDSFYIHKDFLIEYKKNKFQFYRKKYLAMRWK